eukprot:4000694-Prymnesium_polylepis.1
MGASIVLKQRAAMSDEDLCPSATATLEQGRRDDRGGAVVKCVIDGHDWCGIEVIWMVIRSADETRALSS